MMKWLKCSLNITVIQYKFIHKLLILNTFFLVTNQQTLILAGIEYTRINKVTHAFLLFY